MSTNVQRNNKIVDYSILLKLNKKDNSGKRNNARKAGVLSCIFPGAGQIFNGEFLKGAMIFTVFIFSLIFNKKQQVLVLKCKYNFGINRGICIFHFSSLLPSSAN